MHPSSDGRDSACGLAEDLDVASGAEAEGGGFTVGVEALECHIDTLQAILMHQIQDTLKAKCTIIARDLNVQVGDIVLKSQVQNHWVQALFSYVERYVR